MKRLKKMLWVFMVFLAGLVCSINLTWLKYGIPEHYDGSWAKVGLALVFGVGFGWMATSD